MNGAPSLGPSPPLVPSPLSVDGSIGKGTLGLCGRGSWAWRADVHSYPSLHFTPGSSCPAAFFSGEKAGAGKGVVMTEPTLSLHRMKALQEKRKCAKSDTFGNQMKGSIAPIFSRWTFSASISAEKSAVTKMGAYTNVSVSLKQEVSSE